MSKMTKSVAGRIQNATANYGNVSKGSFAAKNNTSTTQPGNRKMGC